MAPRPEDGFVRATSVEDVRTAGRLRTTVDGHPIGLFRHDEVYAVDDRCSHMGVPLTRGTVEDSVLTWHSYWHRHLHRRMNASTGSSNWRDDVDSRETRHGVANVPRRVPDAIRARERERWHRSVNSPPDSRGGSRQKRRNQFAGTRLQERHGNDGTN